jgi:hypothetical protein
MNRRFASFSLLTVALATSACSAETGPVDSVAPSRAGLLRTATEVKTLCLSPTELSASYRFDASEDRGRIDIDWDDPNGGPASITVQIEGAAAETANVPAGQTQYLSGTRVQDTSATDGDIQVSVTLTLDCGTSVRRDFWFVDPLLLCPTTQPNGIPGNEAAFYECAEQWVNQGEGCGTEGYLLGYGGRYAKRFYNWTRPRMTSWGRPFIDGTLVCLQQDLQSEISVASSCDTIRAVAFSQHPDCYLENGFCKIGPWNTTLVASTPDGDDLLSKEGREQIQTILDRCGRQYTSFSF